MIIKMRIVDLKKLASFLDSPNETIEFVRQDEFWIQGKAGNIDFNIPQSTNFAGKMKVTKTEKKTLL